MAAMFVRPHSLALNAYFCPKYSIFHFEGLYMFVRPHSCTKCVLYVCMNDLFKKEQIYNSCIHLSSG